MRNLIKKSLAFLLVATLALACFVGTLTVSAADAYNANISVTANPVTLGDTEATAIINVAMVEENVGINEALIKVTSTIGAVAKEVELVKDAAGTAYSEEELTALDYVVDYVGNDISDYGLFYLSAKTATYAIPAAFIKVTFTVGADIAAGTYAINIDVPESKVIAATPDEVAVNFIYDNENPVCFTVEDKVVEPDCEHSNKTVVSATPAIDGGDNGSIVFTCNDCEKEIVETVTYFRNSMLAGSPTIGLNASTELNLRLNNNNYEGKGATDGFVVYTHKYVNGAEPSVHIESINKAKYDASSNYYIWTVPVKFNEFADTYEIYVYSKHETGWVSGLVREFSIKSAAMTIVTNKSNALGLRQVAANLLKAGAETQKLAAFESANLADVDLVGEYASLVTTTAPSIVKDETNWVPCANYSTDKEGYFVTPSVKLGDAVKFNTKAALKYYEGQYNVEDLKIKYSYTSFNTAEISGEITSEDFVWTASNSRAEFDLGLIAPNMRSTINFQIYNGDTPISKVATYSIESAMAQALSGTPSYQNVINALLNYSDCVKANANLF